MRKMVDGVHDSTACEAPGKGILAQFVDTVDLILEYVDTTQWAIDEVPPGKTTAGKGEDLPLRLPEAPAEPAPEAAKEEEEPKVGEQGEQGYD